MSDDDLIRRGDAKRALILGDTFTRAQAKLDALPAVTLGVSVDIDELAYRFWSIHPKEIPEPIGMPEGYKGGRRAWFYATEMRNMIAALPAALTPPADLAQRVKE